MYVIGYATEEEIAQMNELEIDVEPAEKYNLVGRAGTSLLPPPGESPSNTKAVVVWLDASVIDVVTGLASARACGARLLSDYGVQLQDDDGFKNCSTCGQRMMWSPSGHHCLNQNCVECHDEATTC